MVGDFSEGLAKVWIGDFYTGNYSFINKKGKVVIKPKYDDVGDFSEGLAIVEKSNKWGFINKKGKEIVKPKYDKVVFFSEGLARLRDRKSVV